jgi:1-acyl-sn-glycerol-3-phosphate acyltransferase
VAGRGLGFWRRFAVIVVKPFVTVFTRRTWKGAEYLPRTGPAVIVANHISHADPLALAHFVYDAGRWPQFLVKASVFKVPVVGALLTKVQQIPVQRGTADAARALDAATRVVEAGHAIIIYPEGTTSKEPDLWPMRGKTGAARLALATGTPLIPVVSWGAQQIFDPRTKKKRFKPRTPVTVVAGPPIDLSRWADAAPSSAVLAEITNEIMNTLRAMIGEVRGAEPPPLWVPTPPTPPPTPAPTPAPTQEPK